MSELLREIRIFDGGGPVALANAFPDELNELLAATTCGIPPHVLRCADAMASTWMRLTVNPFYDELRQINRLTRRPGLFAMNLSADWGCTTAVRTVDGIPSLVRTLDWPMPRLGNLA